MISVAAIIQAGMGPARFPGKSLRPIAGLPLPEHIIIRLKQVPEIAGFIAQVFAAIPWHRNAAGLQFVYSRHFQGQVKNTGNTCCPQCRKLLLERIGFQVLSLHLKGYRCPFCNVMVPCRRVIILFIKHHPDHGRWYKSSLRYYFSQN